jgi:glutathione S-transferase
MVAPLKLISHKLCPYVQRAVIALTERGVAFERIDIDLANKPDWFLAISPLGKTPVLQVGDTAIFESAVILEYLEETQQKQLHPADPLARAEHRAWIEYGSTILNDIAGFYAARDEATFKAKSAQLEQRFARLEARVAASPWFDGESFALVDAVFGPVFRYFDVFDEISDFGVLTGKPKLARWRRALAARPSVRAAVGADYAVLLRDFIDRRQSWLSGLQAHAAA